MVISKAALFYGPLRRFEIFITRAALFYGPLRRFEIITRAVLFYGPPRCFEIITRAALFYRPLPRFNDVISRVALSRCPVQHRRRRHLQGRTVQVPCAASPTSSTPGSHCPGPLCRIADVVNSRVTLSRSPVPHRRRRNLQGSHRPGPLCYIHRRRHPLRRSEFQEPPPSPTRIAATRELIPILFDLYYSFYQ
ncbi:hypothetical protein Zmor_014473 [Zophobas morio]|uniref:Uncharacterized protein n=1 Tax=Zophobas morio TaxID=2755281 RepID=A0AA38IHT3_9CUCU|nr:hypothetical protein Zmor_014473 [Zophobas morio]